MTRSARLALSLAVSPGSNLAGFFLALPEGVDPFGPDLACYWREARPIPRRIFTRLRQGAETYFVRAAEVERWAEKNGMTILFPDDPAWPRVFNMLFAPPLVLYVLGDASILNKPMTTVVGTRRPTAAGLCLASHLGSILARQGQVVVSGGASGIDSAAHAGALEGGGQTLAVLGGGIDQLYPGDNSLLFARLVEKGALVSEYPPGTPATPWRFPLRNRIMAALGHETIVVQAPVRSGTYSTVVEALAVGRDVRVCLWPPECAAGAGCLRLAGLGAGTLIDGSELLAGEAEYQPLAILDTARSEDEANVLMSIKRGFIALDDLVEVCRLPVERVMTACMRLELDGRIGRFGARGFEFIPAA